MNKSVLKQKLKDIKHKIRHNLFVFERKWHCHPVFHHFYPQKAIYRRFLILILALLILLPGALLYFRPSTVGAAWWDDSYAYRRIPHALRDVPMPVLTIANSKGGCGKTTIATSLAAVLAGEGLDVGLLDSDPNGSAHRWAITTYTGPKMASYAEPDKDRLADLLPILADRHVMLIADTAGFGNLAATICMVGADVILIPVSPGEGDIVEARKTVGFIDGLARTARRPIPARIVPNRIKRGTTLSRHTLSEIEALSLPRLQTAMSEAVAYGELSFSGALPITGVAAAEIAALVAELRNHGWLPAPLSTCKDSKT